MKLTIEDIVIESYEEFRSKEDLSVCPQASKIETLLEQQGFRLLNVTIVRTFGKKWRFKGFYMKQQN